MRIRPDIPTLLFLWTVLIAAFLNVFTASVCCAGGGPENVFLLVNSQSVDSITVANQYIHLRKIPPSNVFYISRKPGRQSIKSKQFRNEILVPALEEIVRRKLGSQIDYLIYSCDFPWRVMFDADFPEQEFSKRQRPWTSLTGASYLWTLSKDPNLALFNISNNFYFAPQKDGLSQSRAFRSSYWWARGGQRSRVKKGIPYMLSAMLGVTDERGNSVGEMVRYLKKASKADGTQPKGTIYFVENKSIRSTPRHNLFPAAKRELAVLGVRAEIVRGFFPKNKSDVMGVTTGGSHIDVRGSRSLFRPGAFCDNLTSYGGVFLRPKKQGPKPRQPQTNVCEYLRYGASGACGTVVEPTNDAKKFPSPFFHVHYAHGCSLAEAFYRSVSGPYLQILVGDPLCQPWAKIPRVTVAGIQSGDWIQGEIEFVPAVQLDEHQRIRHFELFVDGLRMKICKPGGKFSLDTKTLADGFHELRVVAVDQTPIETQGRWIGEVTVKNGNQALQLSVDKSLLNANTKHLSVKVTSTSQKTVTVLHNGQKLGQVSGGNGMLSVEARKLGSGPIALVGVIEEAPGLRSQPLRIELP